MSEVHASPSPTRQSGALKWFNRTKGFGFIRKDGYDVFLHADALPRTPTGELVVPADGQSVMFDEVKNGEKGYRAVNVAF